MTVTTTPHIDVADLGRQITGTLLLPGDDGYDEASTVYAAKGTPALIVRPAGAAEVAAAIRFASTHDLLLSVRSGGHSGNGFGTNDGGLVIDLSTLRDVEVIDDDRRLVRIGGGAIWGDIADALKPHGLALSSGDTTTVGVGGLTLGGGIGWMVRQYGLALDSLVSAEVVTATGDVLTASATSEPDLFWAIRGGGGNFGVVTSFTFEAHPLPGVIAGPILYDLDHLAELLTGWRDVMRTAPEELSTTFLAMPAFGEEMPAGVQILCCYGGENERAAMAAIEPLLSLPGMRGHDLKPKAYRDVLEEAMSPEGLRIVDNNAFAPDFSDQLIDELVAVYGEIGGAILMIRSLTGAFTRVPEDATAFAFRDSEVLIIVAAFLALDAPDEAATRVRALWKTLAPHLRGSYGNFMSTVGPDAVAAIYPPPTYERLAAIKRRYDPDNLFRQNQNIVPEEPGAVDVAADRSQFQSGADDARPLPG